MSAKPCLPEDIFEVNKNKEYTLISTDLLESVLTDTRLNAQTTKLWQILFNKARYNPSFEVKISYSYLAKKLGKSTRTIARYVDALQNTGYLIVSHNFDNNGGQRPSTLSVRVPSTSIEQTNKRKDRVNKKHSINNVLLLNEKECEKIEDKVTKEHPVNVTKLNNEPTSISVLCETICNRDNSTVIDFQSDNKEIESSIINTDVTPSNQEISSMEINGQDRNDREWYDSNVIQKDNNKKEINNNNIVVSFSPNENKIKKIRQDIQILEQRLIEGDKNLLPIQDHILRYDQMRKNMEMEASLRLAYIALERVKNEIIKNEKKDKVLSDLDNPRFMLDKEGERIIPIFTFKRLVKSLKCYGYSGNMLNTLINEIIFEVRFGSLINSNKAKTTLSVDNAINIGLKLVREKKWSTPVCFMQDTKG